MKYPKISVIIPNYNDAGYLEETICSVVNQEYPNTELIIIDGGSTDNSLEIIRKYEGRIAYWVSEPDGGPGPAVAKGLGMATGEILAWLCSNDLYLPGCLERVARAFEQSPEIDFIYGSAHWIDAQGNLLRIDRTKVPDLHKAMLYAHWLPPQHSCFWRHTLYQRCQVAPAMRVAHDFDFFLRASANAHIKWIEEPLAAFRIHPRTEDFNINGGVYVKRAWLKFINDHQIPRWRILIGSVYWTLRVRYAFGGWRKLFSSFRLEYLRTLLKGTA